MWVDRVALRYTFGMTERHWKLLIAGMYLAMMLGFGGLAIVNEFRKPLANKDYPIWYAAGVDAMSGQDIYAIHTGSEMNFTYPPFAAVCVYGPLSLLGNHGFVIGLVVLQSLAWAVAIIFSIKLVAGALKFAHPLLLLLPGLVTIGGVWTSYQLGQANLMLLALMLVGFYWLNDYFFQPGLKGGAMRFCAGGLFAVAAAFKAFPVLIVVYLIWRRQWVALGGMVAGLVLCLLILPALVRGFDQAQADLVTWTDAVMLTSNEGQIGQRQSAWAYSRENQSLKATVVRLTHAMPFHVGEDGAKPTVNVVDVGYRWATLLYMAVGLLLALGQAWLMPSLRRSDYKTLPIEQAMVMCLITIGSPLAWGYYFVWLLFPLTVALYHIGEMWAGRERVVWLVWWFVMGLLPLVAADVPVIREMHASGTATWAAIGLWAGLGIWLVIETSPAPKKTTAQKNITDDAKPVAETALTKLLRSSGYDIVSSDLQRGSKGKVTRTYRIVPKQKP